MYSNQINKVGKKLFPQGPVLGKRVTTERIAGREHISAGVCHSKFYVWSIGIARLFTKKCCIATVAVTDVFSWLYCLPKLCAFLYLYI